MKSLRTKRAINKGVLYLTGFLLLITIFNQADLNGQSTSKPRPPNSLYLRAPDTIPGTLPEMRQPSFWIARMKDPDRIVMTVADIEKKNKDYSKRMDNLMLLDSNLRKQITREMEGRPGIMPSVPDLSSKSPAELSVITRNMIEKEINFLKRRVYGNILGIEYSAQEISVMEEEMAFSSISYQVKIQPAITVKNCLLRIIPAIRPEYVGNNTLSRWDMWNYDVVPIGSPVQILHISKTGGYLFVLSDKGYGWVNSEEVAISTKENIVKFCNSGDYIVCTGERVPYYSDATCTMASGWFRMGDRLPSKSGNARVVQVPSRQMNGNLLIQDAWLKPDADVSKGYLPYSTKNVVIQTFKILDFLYDWTGGWFGRDHATSMRDIFSCFGFKLPANGVMQTAFYANPEKVSPKAGKEAQYKAIKANEPFITIQICSSGHGQLYLGEYKGEPIVFDTHGYAYKDKNGDELVIRRSNIGTLTYPDYFLKQDITFVELK
jgi:hypothetical protein